MLSPRWPSAFCDALRGHLGGQLYGALQVQANVEEARDDRVEQLVSAASLFGRDRRRCQVGESFKPPGLSKVLDHGQRKSGVRTTQ